MKTLARLISLAVAVMTVAHAGPLMVSNSKGFNSTPIVDETGLTVTGLDPVIVAVGTFASEPSADLTAPDHTLGSGIYAGLLAEFTAFGPQTVMTVPAAPLNLLGVFSFQYESPVSGTPLDGKPVYIVVAKGPDLASATSVCILKTTATFDPAEDDNALPNRVPVGTAHGTTLIAGSIGLFSASASNLDPTLEAAWSMAAIAASAAEIGVQSPVSTDLTDNADTFDFGNGPIGSVVGTRTVTVTNLGTSNLTDLDVTITGTDAANFSVDTALLPATLTAENSGSFEVSFAPSGSTSGPRNAVVEIASNDADENPFEIALTGFAFSPTADADADGLNDWAEHLLGPLGFDWQTPQPALVTALNDGANAAGLFTPSQVQALHAGIPLISRDPVTGRFTLTTDWQKSTDLSSFTDFPASPADVSVNGSGDIEFEFIAPDDAAFYRIETE